MKALLPESSSDPVDLVEWYATPDDRSGRPFVRCNMISSFDGAIAVNGRSGSLGGPGDREIFAALRSRADVIVVGAGTVRAENYGPVRLSDALRQSRLARGQPAVPPIAIVTRSANLDWSSPLFADAEIRPLIITTKTCDRGEAQRGEKVADFVIAGEDLVDPSVAFGELHDRGYASVLLEGGPGLNADVVHAGLLDELCLTLSPRLVAGTGSRLFAGDELAPPVGVQIEGLLEDDGFLFFRLRLARDS